MLLCALLAGPLTLSAWAIARPENRVGGSAVFSSDFASQESDKLIAASREGAACGYDFASGVHKYLYAADDAVNRIDPSGQDGISFTLPGFLSVASLGATIDGFALPVTTRAFSWAAFRVITAAIAIGTVETGDNGGKALFFHYSSYPPASFEDGLFPPAYVTPVGGLDAKSAMFKLGIDIPSYEYTFNISWYMLGPPNNFTPGRIELNSTRQP
ncbi:MAG: hypothetical protein ABSE16_20535 [Verrucomicrobiota bacterium]